MLQKLCAKRCFSRSFCSAVRPEFDPQPSLLDLNTGINPNGTNDINEITNLAQDKKEFFVGRIPLIGICEDSNSTYMNGPQHAPNIIRKAFLCSSGSFDQYYPNDKVFINTETALIDCGNLNCSGGDDHDNIIQLLENMYNINATISRFEGYLPHPLLILGGDHSITFPVLTGIIQSEPFQIGNNKFGVIHFDAHPDLYPPEVIDPEGANPYSHASPFYNLLETQAIDQLLQIGIRCMGKGQQSTLEKYDDKIQQLYMEQLFNDDDGKSYNQLIRQRVKEWLDVCKKQGINNFYISIDIDVLEPCFVPGISHYEPFGLSTKELFIGLDIIMTELYKNKNNLVIGCDIVEYNPLTDYNYMTAFVAARLMRRIVANDIKLSDQ